MLLSGSTIYPLMLGFVLIGAGAIFATFSGVTNIVANISWAFAIALAIMLIPIAFASAKKCLKKQHSVFSPMNYPFFGLSLFPEETGRIVILFLDLQEVRLEKRRKAGDVSIFVEGSNSILCF